MVVLLMKYGADPHSVDNEGKPILISVATRGLSVLEKSLNSAIPRKTKLSSLIFCCFTGCTCLHVACHLSQTAIAAYLIAKGMVRFADIVNKAKEMF